MYTKVFQSSINSQNTVGFLDNSFECTQHISSVNLKVNPLQYCDANADNSLQCPVLVSRWMPITLNTVSTVLLHNGGS
jgi:hypothetical protein